MTFKGTNYQEIDDSLEEENVMTPGWAIIVVLFFVMYFGVIYLQHQYDLKYNVKRAQVQVPPQPTPASQGWVIRP